MKQIRQGDVFVTRIKTIPDDVVPVPRDNGRVVLAYGEVTGHSHAIEESHAALLERPSAPRGPGLTAAENERFLRIVGAAANLVHEEHATIAIPPGTYRVTHQREWTDQDEPRRVVD